MISFFICAASVSVSSGSIARPYGAPLLAWRGENQMTPGRTLGLDSIPECGSERRKCRTKRNRRPHWRGPL